MPTPINQATGPGSGQVAARSRSRLGPRPLALHLAQAESAWRHEDPRRLADFLRGVRAYRDHPYQRIAPKRKSVWQSGSAQLVDWGPSDAWPTLIVPSLINRGYILDLMPAEGEGLLSFLSHGGLRPFLLDWGEPASTDRRLSLDELVLGRLESAIDWLIDETGCRPLLLGHCLGGTLATAAACRRPADLAGLALLAAPWDFHAESYATNPLRFSNLLLSSSSGTVGGVSVDVLQAYFAFINPMAVPKKFADFSRMEQDSNAAIRFVAVEDWLNDGIPFGAEVADHCLSEWYRANAPALGKWKVGGRTIEPSQIDLPAYLAVPTTDRIVSPASALALAKALPRAEIIRPTSGHVGMMIGHMAKKQLWQPLLAWLMKAAAMQA